VVTEPALYPPLPFTQNEVPRLQMHLFTAVQFAAAAILFIVEESRIALGFPVFLILTIPLCKGIPTITCGAVSQKTVDILNYKEDAPSALDLPKSYRSALPSLGAQQSEPSVKTGFNDVIQECLLEHGNAAEPTP